MKENLPEEVKKVVKEIVEETRDKVIAYQYKKGRLDMLLEISQAIQESDDVVGSIMKIYKKELNI